MRGQPLKAQGRTCQAALQRECEAVAARGRKTARKDAARSGRPPPPQAPQEGRPQPQRPPEGRERGEGGGSLSPRKSEVIGGCRETEIQGGEEIRAARQETIQRSKETLQPSALQLCGSSWFLCTTSARQRVIFPIPKNSAVFREAVFRALLRLRQWQEAALSCTATKRSSSPCPHGTVIQGEELTGLARL